MPDPVGPKFIPKAVLTAGRVLHQPFEIPTEMTKSALLQGGTIHAAVGSLNKAAADAVAALEPRGPAKLLDRLFGKVDGSLVHSAGQAQKATEVFWVPFSNGAHQVGHAVSNPFSMFYANRAGFTLPTDPAELQAMLATITAPGEADAENPSTKFPGFNNWPAPPPPAEEPKTEEPKTEEPKTEEPKTEEPKTEEPKTEEPKTTDGEVETTGAGGGTEQPTGEQPTGDQPTGQQPTGEQPTGEQPTPTDPAATEQPTTTDPAAANGGVTDPAATPNASEVPEGARGAVAPAGHPAGVDPAVMAAAAGAADVQVQVQVQDEAAAPQPQPGPVADATAGAQATTVSVDAG